LRRRRRAVFRIFRICYEFPESSFRPFIARRFSTAYSFAPLTTARMQTGNSIIIQAPRETIFATAADLARWPRILPHYRYIHFLRRLPDRSIVKMAAVRSGIPISWTSEFVIDRERMELRFLHLKAFTRGMRVIWTFRETPAGVLVEIMHALRFRVHQLAPIAE